jgi:hypothetical protein
MPREKPDEANQARASLLFRVRILFYEVKRKEVDCFLKKKVFGT